MNAFLRFIYVGSLIFTDEDLVTKTNDVRVSVEAAQVVRSVDARMFGMNTAIWDPIFDTPDTVVLLRELGVQALRFPGGSLSDAYHWASHTSIGRSRAWPASFANFVHVATNIQAEVFLTVNYGSGTPEEAAAWVRCANGTNNCGFKYWEIGNENYGDWEYDEYSTAHDPLVYATRTKEFFNQMKAADPAIKIGVVVAAEGYRDWTPKMLAQLKQLGVTPDFVIHHLYPQYAGGENDARLLQSTAQWTADATKLRAQLKNCFGDGHTHIELICTENNSVSEKMGKQTTSLVNGLYLADSFGQIAQTEFNSFLWWDFRNMQESNHNNRSSLYGWRPYGDHGILSGHQTRYPTFYTFKLLTHFARGGDRIVRATSDHKLLSVYAARRASGDLSLLVINKSPSATAKANISIADFQPASAATLYSYGIPQDDAARTGTGSEDIAESRLTGAAARFPGLFAPYSASVIVLSPRIRDPEP
jgi:alpha-L-arabinofuranosidase